MSEHYIVMGAGEVGFYLARKLSQEGHSLVVIESDPEKHNRVEAGIDAMAVLGSGTHVPVLEAAGVRRCDLFIAASSSDEANLAASSLAKRLGARRTVVRIGTVEDVTVHRRVYEEVFRVDLLLSTQLLAATRILNYILGHNTLEVEYLLRGEVQLRKIHLDDRSPLIRAPLRDVKLPEGSLVVALFRGEDLIVPGGDERAQSGDDVLVLCKSGRIDTVESFLVPRPRVPGAVVIAGGGTTCLPIAQALAGQVDGITIIECDRRRAEWLAAQSPHFEVVHGDATELSTLRAANVGRARALVSLMGNDERNLMANLLAREELGVPEVIAKVDRKETSKLWRRLGMMHIVSPRQIASERIHSYIRRGYNANIVSLRNGSAHVLERRLEPASPAAGVTLADLNPPRGVIVGALARGHRVFVPSGRDRLKVGDTVILFVEDEHLSTIRLLFPGRDAI